MHVIGDYKSNCFLKIAVITSVCICVPKFHKINMCHSMVQPIFHSSLPKKDNNNSSSLNLSVIFSASKRFMFYSCKSSWVANYIFC